MSAWEGLSPPYATIVADPPWRFGSAATKADARKHCRGCPVMGECRAFADRHWRAVSGVWGGGYYSQRGRKELVAA